jgi:16S rRNA (cytosine1402-N4)-methyltransferase
MSLNNHKDFSHIPVMPKESLDFLITDNDGIYVDATAGLGGHSKLICERISDKGRLVSFDWDSEACQIAKRELAKYPKCLVINASYTDIRRELAKVGIEKIDGILFDFGLSSLQLANPLRGFAFSKSGPLDMRFSAKNALTAGEIVNSWPLEQLQDIIRNYGEERFYKKIALAIIKRREKGEISTTYHLRDVIEKAVPFYRGKGIHPATRTFQALRIAVNSELENVLKGLEEASLISKPGARIVALTFHSLEDRIVKRFFKKLAEEDTWEILTKKPLYPGEDEIENNPRSRSAKLRVAQKRKI